MEEVDPWALSSDSEPIVLDVQAGDDPEEVDPWAILQRL